MSTRHTKQAIVLCLSFLWMYPLSAQEASSTVPAALMPRLPGWSLSEAPRTFSPGTLFEYINGAAENYLSYGFRELIVGDFKKDGGSASLTVEVYDMGDDTRAFGVYSSERYPDSRFVDIGNQGYIEEGTLNFIVGGYYVKLLCFDCGQSSGDVLRTAARQIEAEVPTKGRLPSVLSLFPREGLVANSEKLVLQNVLGFSFLHHGYLADYRAQGQEFELFIIQGSGPQDARDMLAMYLDSQRKAGQPAQTNPDGYQIKDRYSDNIYLALSGNKILGVMGIKDGAEALGKEYLRLLGRSVEN